jgi:hypothetical protein
LFKKESPKKAKCKQYQVIFEQKKVGREIGLLRVEYYENGKPEIVGSFYMPLTKTPADKPPTDWDQLKLGKSRVFGIVIDSREQPLMDKFKGFLSRSLEEGKLQDLTSLIPKIH